MRPEKFDIEEFMNYLRGSCTSLEEAGNQLYGEDFDWISDLTQGELQQLDTEIFQCIECGWWNDKPAEENEWGEWVCTDCYDDEKYETQS